MERKRGRIKEGGERKEMEGGKKEGRGRERKRKEGGGRGRKEGGEKEEGGRG